MSSYVNNTEKISVKQDIDTYSFFTVQNYPLLPDWLLLPLRQ